MSLIESMMVLRPKQGNLRQVFRLFSLVRGFASHIIIFLIFPQQDTGSKNTKMQNAK